MAFLVGFAATPQLGPTIIDLCAAAAGLATVALQIGYLPTIYGAFNRRETEVTLLGVRAVSTTLENEAIATVGNEATQTDWMGDLSGGLGFDPAAGRGRCSAASGRAGFGHR